MKCLYSVSLLMAFLMAFLVALLMAGGVAHGQSPDEAAIRTATRLYQEALQRGDAKTLASLWTPDGDIVDDDGKISSGRETVGRITAVTPNAPRQTFTLHDTSLRFLTTDVAIEDGTVEVTPVGGSTPLKGWFSATWLRHEGSWKLASLRESQITTGHGTPRLADLDWMVGDWTVVENHPAREPPTDEQSGAAVTSQPIEIKVRWNSTRTFLIRDMKIAGAAEAGQTGGDGLPAMHITQRIGWDPLSRQIVSWSFGSDGSHGEATWTREDGTWIARTTAVQPDGTQANSLNIYTYNGTDRCSWRSLPTHVGGEHAPQVTMTMIRKPPAVPPKPPERSPAQ